MARKREKLTFGTTVFASAAKQSTGVGTELKSMLRATPVDCFAALAKTGFVSENVYWRNCGKRITSRIDCALVNSMASLSMPMPSPAVGGRPYSSASI